MPAARYVIRNPQGLYYSDNQLLRLVPTPRAGDPGRNDMRQKFAPIFGTKNVLQALKYSTPQDARDVMAHEDLEEGEESFDGASVCKAEHSDDPQEVEVVWTDN